MIEVYDDILREELAKITPLEKATGVLTDGIAARIDAVMRRKDITKSQLAKMTGRRPSEVTKWLGGGHNFTCKTIALISEALGEDLIQVASSLPADCDAVLAAAEPAGSYTPARRNNN